MYEHLLTLQNGQKCEEKIRPKTRHGILSLEKPTGYRKPVPIRSLQE